MALQLAKRMNGLKASEVREMLKITQRDEIISFAGGLPAPELLPIRELEQATRKVLDEQGPQGVRFSRPSGGLFLWVELPPHLDARELLRRSLERDVAFVPGGGFYPKGNKENTLRLSYSSMPVARIEEGIRRLATAVKEMIGTDAYRELSAVSGGPE